MAKLQPIKGFTMIEILIVLGIVTCLYLFILPFVNISYSEPKVIIADYAYHQHQAINKLESVTYHNNSIIAEYLIKFNARGNVNISQKIIFLNSSKEYPMVIFLGCGRIEIE
ncbi:MAG: type II secretion system protein [Erysipelotrichaceae bacterium]|nr:type II secretion system protein [Erysipelotrichaceae bacterium]